jgi:hypothetical protein
MAHRVCFRCGAGFYSKYNNTKYCEQCRKDRDWNYRLTRPALKPELLPHTDEIEFTKGSIVYNIALMVMDTIRNNIVGKTYIKIKGYKITVEKDDFKPGGRID